jgi:hypothetical protein
MPFQAEHRPEPGLQPSVVCLDRDVRVLPDDVRRRGDQLVKHPQVDRRAVDRDLGRERPGAQRPGEEAPRSRQVTPRRQQNIYDLAILIDRPVEIGPLAGDLQVGLVDELPVARSVPAQPRSLDELAGEALHPGVDGYVIHGDTALGQQLLDIPVGQAIPQVPPDRDRDHLPREPETSEDRGRTRRTHPTSLQPAAIGQRNSATSSEQGDGLAAPRVHQ